MADLRRPSLSDVFEVHRSPALSEPEKVLWTLYRSYDRGEGAWPGDETLQSHMGSPGKPKSIRAVRMYRSALIEKGYLVRELRGPNPAVYRAVVPRDAESCRSTPAESFRSDVAQARQDPAAVRRQDSAAHIKDRRDSVALERQEAAALPEARQDPAAQEVEERQEDRQEERQDFAATPTPPIEEELREYGEEASSGEPERARGSDHGGDGDGVSQFVERHAEAAELLGQLKHPGGKYATAATLRTRFLYVNGDGIPDPSVDGLPLEQRIDLVGAAIVEGIGSGWREWNPRALAGFIRRLRETPAPALPSDPPRMTAAEEEAREAARRDRARTVSALQAIQATIDRESAAELAPWHEAKAWRDAQTPDVRARVDELVTEGVRAQGYTGKKPPLFIEGPVLVAVMQKLQAERSEPAAQR